MHVDQQVTDAHPKPIRILAVSADVERPAPPRRTRTPAASRDQVDAVREGRKTLFVQTVREKL